MPRTPEQMREYQRQRRARQTDEAPARAKSAPRAGDQPIAMESVPEHTHWWRRADDECICDECGQIEPWRGQALNPFTDQRADWPELIQGLQSATITRLLGRINSKPRGDR